MLFSSVFVVNVGYTFLVMSLANRLNQIIDDYKYTHKLYLLDDYKQFADTLSFL